jgi:hypothetical protein
VSDLRNASRLATYVDTVVNVYESGAWRRYTDATGRSDEWREREFDYFLIACGADYSEVQRLLTWDKARAVDLASAMESDDAALRRRLEDASATWQSPTGVALADLGIAHGWTRASGQVKVPPAPARARARARHGLTMDEHARQARAGQIDAERRRELDGVGAVVLSRVTDATELGYVLDVLRNELRRRRDDT